MQYLWKEVTSATSLKERRSKSGPKFEPYDTPEGSVINLEVKLRYLKYCFWFIR